MGIQILLGKGLVSAGDAFWRQCLVIDKIINGDGGEAFFTLKDGRAQVILEAAGKYSFIKEFIKVRDRALWLLERG